jgi:hypothetical protein
VCGWVPTTCAALGKNCGAIADGCGDAIDCGPCASPSVCTNNVCTACVPTTCAAQGKDCGAIDDGCGNTLACGSCTGANTCGGGGITNKCGVGGNNTRYLPFSAGALVIPMDQCYNPDYAVNADTISDGTTCSLGARTPCYKGTGYSGGNIRLPFGMLYLLAMNGVPVSIILKPDKRGLGDPDFSVTPPTGATTQTVSDLKPSSGVYSVVPGAITSGTNTVYYGGMPFVVDGPYADQALQVIKNFNSTHAGFFDAVPLHVINYDFTAPVLGVMASRPKPVGIDGSPLTTYFDESGIGTVTNNTAYVTINGTSPNFSYTWPSAVAGTNVGCPGDSCTSLTYTLAGQPTQRILDVIWVHDAMYQNFSDMGAWYSAGGTALVVADATQWEAQGPGGVGGGLRTAANGAQKGPYCATVGVSGTNLNANPGPSGDYPASNKFLQIGDMDLFVHGVGGGDGSAYTFNSSPYPHTHTLTNTLNYTALTGHPKVNGVQVSGNVVYLGSLNSWHGNSAGKDAGLHILYNTLLVGGDGGGSVLPVPAPLFTDVELSRSPPVSRATGEFYVGTFDWQVPSDPASAGNQLFLPSPTNYPYTTGHFREFKNTGTGFISLDCDPSNSQAGCNWDLGNNIEAWATRSSRVFVGSVSSSVYTMTAASSLTSDATITFIGNNIGTKLGGVDYSTPAVIEGKQKGVVTIAGAQNRPTIGYVGARDGMLHAVCVVAEASASACSGSGTTPCCYSTYAPGHEIWAFIPPGVKAQLDTAVSANDFSKINVGGVVRVADVQDKFNGPGNAADFRTILLVGTRESGHVVALDVSNPDPTKPNQDGFKLLWQQDGTVVDSGVTSYQMGSTQGVSLSLQNKSVVAVATSAVYNATGTTTPKTGINGYVLRITDGKVLDSYQKLYTRVAPLIAGSTATLPNDVPATPTTLDTDADNIDETVLFADYEGVIKRAVLDPTTTKVKSGTLGTVFDTNIKCSGTTLACQPIGAPLTIGRVGSAGTLTAFAITGGADWARSATTQSWAFGFPVPSGTVSSPTTQTATFGQTLGNVTQPNTLNATGLSFPLRGYAQLTIAGSDLFAEATTLSVGNNTQLILPLLYPGPPGGYGQVLVWHGLNGTIDTSPTALINLTTTTFSGGTGAVLETDTNGTAGALTVVGTSQAERITLAAGSSSLSNPGYAINQTPTGQRNFQVLTWIDLSN